MINQKKLKIRFGTLVLTFGYLIAYCFSLSVAIKVSAKEIRKGEIVVTNYDEPYYREFYLIDEGLAWQSQGKQIKDGFIEQQLVSDFTQENTSLSYKETVETNSYSNLIDDNVKFIPSCTDCTEIYPIVFRVWSYLKAHEFSDEITCAIIGNMMVETAGGTLKLNPDIYDSSKSYYGLCQWSIKYNPEIKDANIDYQLDYLIDSIEYEYSVFGDRTFEEFIKMTDIKEAAISFAKSYERCASWSYEKRIAAAEIAYDYFQLFNETSFI